MQAKEERISVLFDTDIGTDIDDALALAYLLNQPRCELVGITTVTGEPQRRAMLADAICRAARRLDVPIHSGAAEPLLVEQKQKVAQQAEVLSKWEHGTEFPPNTAIEFMRQTIHQRPGEITLLAVGPLTNVALLFATDPEIPHLLRRVVLMNGIFSNKIAGAGPREWNAMGDPHATAIVYRAPVQELTAVGLDVTCQCRIKRDELESRFCGGVMELVGAMAQVWFRCSDVVTFHDPLAAAVVFEPDLCEYEYGTVEVELKSDHVLGMTHWLPQTESKPHRIAIDVDRERFFQHYFQTIVD